MGDHFEGYAEVGLPWLDSMVASQERQGTLTPLGRWFNLTVHLFGDI
jgi:hypothetical protein